MAWEITAGGHKSGEPEVVVSDADAWGSTELVSNDMHDLTTSTPNGNFLFLTSGHSTVGDPQNPGNGSAFISDDLTTSHGTDVISTSVAMGDNDNNRPTSFAPMLGVAYKSLGIGTDQGGFLSTKIDLGAGGNPPGEFTWPVVVNESYSGSREDNKTPMDDGIVVVAAAGNNMSYDLPAFEQGLNTSGAENKGNVSPTSDRKPPITDGDGQKVYEYWPFAVYPAAEVWPDASDATKDLKVIAVAATMDGNIVGSGSGCTTFYNFTGQAPPRWIGQEQAAAGNINFSLPIGSSSATGDAWPENTEGMPFGPSAFGPGFNKFPNPSTYSTATARQTEKESAYVDLIAPGSAMIVPSDPPGYNPNIAGTSLSAPEVAGVVALTRAVNRNYSSMQTDGSLENLSGDDIQRQAYDILTFTATKIPDASNFTLGSRYQQCTSNHSTNGGNTWICDSWEWDRYPSTYSYTDGNSATVTHGYQFNYVQQTYDPLGRSWAQRVGFGEVNAYRAVANSISLKGAYSYTPTQSFTFSNLSENENSQFLMHFGAWKDATHRVLSWWNSSGTKTEGSGGNTVPNQNLVPPYVAWPYDNQGQTMLNSSSGTPTVLTVGNNPSSGNYDILAIDGNLIGDGLAANEIKTTSNGKILITGYLQDVSIVSTTSGPVKADDLIIYSSGASGYANITVNSSTSTPSEIYGLVQLQDYAQLNVNGYLTVQPGGEIEMEGNKNFEISSGGHVKMNASTTIASASTQEVIVDNGATLEISGLLPVNVLCEIDVKSGGTLVIDDGADLQLNQFLIEQGGTFTCNPGGRLTLNLALYNYCYGDFNFVGISGDPRITLTGGVTTCGTVDQFAGIICVGNVASQGNAYMRMQYVDDSDVYMSGRDVPKDLFLNDYFSSSSALTTDFGDQYWYGPASLLYLNNSAVSIAEPAVRDAYLLYCRFFDQAVGATWHFFNGLNTYNLAGLYVNTSAFYNLSTGIETWNCPNASYYSNSFGTNVDPGSGSSVGPLQIGILDHSSGSLYCSNTISNCTLGISADHDMFGSLFDNTFAGYAKTEYCLSTQTSGHYMLRNNTFTAYPLYGIYSLGTGNEVILRDDGALEYGRNTMTSIRPFHSPASADLAKVNSGTFAVACGLNTFGAPSIFQILNLDVPIYSINVGGNNWLGLSPVREHNCLTSGTPLNEAGTSAPDCGSRDDASPPSCGIVCCAVPTDPNPPSAAWFTLDSSSSELRSAATSARGMMLSDTLDPVTRALEARTELWAASLTDSFSTYLPLVLNDYKALLLDPLATPELKSSVWMLKGQLNEMLGLQDSAAVCYDTVIANYHQFVDSVYALWDLQRLGIPDTETLSIDSGEYAFSQREYHDLLAMIDTISAPDTGWGAGKIADGHAEPEVASLQVTVHPNPVAGIVKICVEDLPGGVPVTVDVVNQMGQSVATLYNATPEAELGLCLSLDCAQLPSGIYYADLQTGGFHHAVKFSVEH